jgi:hypothetical protein
MGNGGLRCNIGRRVGHPHAHSRPALRKRQARSGDGSGLDQIHPAARGRGQGRLPGIANSESGNCQRVHESTERLVHELSPPVPRENTLREALKAAIQPMRMSVNLLALASINPTWNGSRLTPSDPPL